MPSKWREHRISKIDHGEPELGPTKVNINITHQEVADLIRERLTRPSKHRDRFIHDIQMCRDAFQLDCKKVQRHLNTMQEQVTLLLGQGVADIAALRLLELYLPMLVTLQRIELDWAKVNGNKLWPHDDIRNYTGNLQRVS